MARTFFPNKTAFLLWRQGMPGITPCYENQDDRRLADSQDPCYPTSEGPYYAGPEYLLLRVGPGLSARYNVLVRVEEEAQADYYLFIRGHQPGQGEKVFAAYLWDHGNEGPPIIVGGATLREAQAALHVFLGEEPLFGKLTRRLPFLGS